MIIKKYIGESETEAIMLAKEDLGKDAIVTNIKRISPKGIFKFFRKPSVEVTAAIDDEKPPSKSYSSNNNLSFEEKIQYIQNLLQNKDEEEPIAKDKEEVIEENQYKGLIFEQLLSNGLEEKYIKNILNESNLSSDLSLEQTLAQVYQNIVFKLGETNKIDFEKGKCKYVFFVGPTGVGKTTTIAKIASCLSIYEGAKVGLLTLDTYRIAAVEQLRTYASILELPFNVAYSLEEFDNLKDEFTDFDLVLVDTAGMSHKNKEKQQELKDYINVVDENNRDVFLVLSSTTKYEDLISIAKHYSSLIPKFSLIFTKLDETSNIGCILNLKLLTGANLSYVTTGQNVPDDILVIDTLTIAKQLLGGIE
ncbi:MAG: flagellar biosynthesis protein FlhF [Clostridiales bacterium]|nr:flagellar biosynthesis protein FlhF [Clostridiales bacterium]